MGGFLGLFFDPLGDGWEWFWLIDISVLLVWNWFCCWRTPEPFKLKAPEPFKLKGLE